MTVLSWKEWVYHAAIYWNYVLISLPLYDSSLANKRWTNSYYILPSDARFSEPNIPAECESTTLTGTEETNLQILWQSQKFNNLTRTCQILASVGSEWGIKQFVLRHKQLQKMMEQWKIGKEVTMIESNEKIDMIEGNWMCDISYFHFS